MNTQECGALLWRRGPAGLSGHGSVNTDPGAWVGGTAQEPSCRLPPAAPLRGRLQQLVGNPSGSDGQAPEDMWRPGLGPVLSGAPSRLLAPGWLDRAGCPSGRTGTPAVEAGLLQELVASLGSCGPASRQRQTGARSPARPPPPAAVLRDCHTRGAFTGNGPAPWALSPAPPWGPSSF